MTTIDRPPVLFRNPPLSAQLTQRIARDFTPRWEKQWGGKFVLHGRQPTPNSIRLDGNDYLNISGHPDIVQAQVDALTQSQESVVQSAVFHLDQHPACSLATEMAHWMGKEDGFICTSGFSANTGLLQIIASAETPVYLDMLAHASLWEGAHAARAPAYGFRHNDVAHLSRIIAKNGPGVVVVDSVYSTTGALCPLAEILAVTEKYGCMIVVDESHSLGTHGPGGAGLCAALGLSERVHFVTASLAKAFAGRAGFFSMPSAMRYYMLVTNHSNIFSSSLLPYEIAGLAATLSVVRDSNDARARLHAHTKRLRTSLLAMGYPIEHGSEQIIALEAGSESDTTRLRDHLETRGVHGAIFCAPATSRDRAMVRLTLNAGLTASEIERIELAAKEVAAIVKPWEWQIAKRTRKVRS
ncbi:MAG: alpha-hydroxyketone-type quorum-sensing autoinducer synthase [Pseudomonadota bacterium]